MLPMNIICSRKSRTAGQPTIRSVRIYLQMRWMKSWAKTARRDRLRHTGPTFLVLMLLGGIALPQETTLRSQSNVVLVPVLVKDQQGGIVYGLQTKDFIVEDDGVEQPAR